MKKNSLLISLLCIAVILIAMVGCVQPPNATGQSNQQTEQGATDDDAEEGDGHGSEEEDEVSLVGNVEIQQELARLISLASKKTITQADFKALEGMVEGNHDAEEEVEEFITLVKYREYMHAAHGMTFLDGYIKTGKELLCPPHALGHYYVFNKHAETEKAEHGLEEAEEQMDEWLEKGEAYYAKYPAATDFSEVAEVMKEHLEQIESGKKTATDKEIEFLTNQGSLCVEE